LGLDLICAFTGEGWILKEGVKDEEIIEGGIRWRIIDGVGWYVGGMIKDAEDLQRYLPGDNFTYSPDTFKTTEDIVNMVKGDLAIAGAVGGPFTSSWMLTGFNDFVKAIYANPTFAQKIICKTTSLAIELGKGLIEAGVDLIWIADDLGMTDGPFLRPSHFHKYIFKHFKGMVDAYKKRGVKVLLHSDGHIMPLMDDIVRAGIDGVHPIERKANMSLELMKMRYGDKLTLIGNVEATTLLPHGTPKEIEKQVLECLGTAAPGGGYILASDHSIHEGVPSVKAKILFEAARKHRTYPIRAVNHSI